MIRNTLLSLIEWKNNPARKPLIVRGGRQVGKTHLVVREFAENLFIGKFVYLDCNKETEFIQFCSQATSAADIISYIERLTETHIDNSTLLIFDEVQACLNLISLL